MRTLRSSMVAWTLGAIGASLVIAGGLSLHVQASSARRHLATTHEQVALSLADSMREPLQRAEHEAVGAIVRQCPRGTGVDQIRVLDAYGRVVAQAAVGAVSEPGRGVAESIAGAIDFIYSPPIIRAHVQSAGGERLGLVELTLSDLRANTAIASAILPGLLATLAILACAGAGAYHLAGQVCRPLDAVERSVEALNRGDFSVRLEPNGPAQLATIADGLNDIGARLVSMSASTNFVNNVIHSMVDTLIVVDQLARMKAVNQATLDLLGYTEAELIGRVASLVFVADGQALTAQHLDQLLGHGSKKDHEVIYVRKDGGKIPISLSGSAIKDSRGNTIGYVCIGTDITSRKEADEEREKLHKQLVTTSRQAGMAEVATGVLHNVGNVLNSVNVSASVVEETLRKSKVSRFAQVADLIRTHESDLPGFIAGDERGKVLPGYLVQLARCLNDEQTQLLEEVRTLSSHIGHIKDIISVQQSISRTTGVIEPLDIRELVDDAVLMVDQSLRRHDIAVVREFEPVAGVTTDKHKVLQILVNLLSNASDAIKECRAGEGRITLRLGYADADHTSVRIEVQDNGVGIDEANLTRIFTHGFTTKKTGHGFGLHSAALAAKELHGSLTPSSAGKGHGATFTLTLPCAPAGATAERT